MGWSGRPRSRSILAGSCPTKAACQTRLLKEPGRGGEAFETAWTDYRKHPSRYAYDVAMGGTYLPSVMELLLIAKETERLAQLVGRSSDAALEGVSHHVSSCVFRGRCATGAERSSDVGGAC
jgi:hypothetical protein